MINPAPLPSGYYMVRGIADTPTFAIRIQQEEDGTNEDIYVQVLSQNNHLLAYNDGWQESEFAISDAQTAASFALSNLYEDYYETRGLTFGLELDTAIDVNYPPLGQFRGVIDYSEELTENYPVFANPSPIVSGFYVMNSEEALNLDGLCLNVEVYQASPTTVNVRIAQLQKNNLYVVYRQGSFDAITLDPAVVVQFVGSRFNSYVQQSLQGTGFTVASLNVENITQIDNLPSAKFITKMVTA